MKKTKLSTLGLGLLLSVTGCGAAEVVHNVDQSLAPELPDGVVTIKFETCLGHDKAANLQTLVDEFNAQYAGKFFVDHQVPVSTYDKLHSTLLNEIRTGNVPALAIGYPDSFAEYMGTSINRSNILRLNNFYTDPNYGYDKGADPDPEKPLTNKDFVPSYFNEGTGYQFPGLWSLPMYKSTEVMFYNKDYFNGKNDINEKRFKNEQWWKDDMALFKKVDPETGLKTDLVYYSAEDYDTYEAALATLKGHVQSHGGVTYEVPTKWEKLMIDEKDDHGTITKRCLTSLILKDREDAGLLDTDFYPFGYDSDSNLFISQMMQRGIPYTTNDNISRKQDHVKFYNKQTKELAAELYKAHTDHKLVTKGTLSQSGESYTNNEFTGASGKINMVMCVGSTGGSTYQKTNAFPVGIAPVPYYGETPYYIQQGPSVCFFDNENEQINLGAWLLYQWIADPTRNVTLGTENQYDPIRESSYDLKIFKDYKAGYKTSMLKLVPNVTETIRQYQFTSPVFVGSSTARKEIGNLLWYMRWGSADANLAVYTAYYNTLNKTR